MFAWDLLLNKRFFITSKLIKVLHSKLGKFHIKDIHLLGDLYSWHAWQSFGLV